MDGRKEDLIKFIASLSVEQLQGLTEMLEQWEGEGDDLIEIGLEYGAVAISCKQKDVIHANAT